MSRESTRDGVASVWASHVAFATLGVMNASWAARIPQVKSQLGLGASELGLVLLATAVGSLTALPGSGPVIVRLGSRRALRMTGLLAAAGVAVVAFGARGSTVAVAAGLFLMG